MFMTEKDILAQKRIALNEYETEHGKISLTKENLFMEAYERALRFLLEEGKANGKS